MTCTIHWNKLAPADWESRFAKIPRSTLLQSYGYARAACPLYGQKARWGLIEIAGKEAGLVQILEAGLLWNAFHAVILDRGPLWFEGCGGAAHIKMFFTEFSRQFPARFGRRRRILPEIADGPAASKIIESAGLQKLADRPGYQTLWLDLQPEDETLRASLGGKWRGHLNKAERSGLSISWNASPQTLSWFIGGYAKDKMGKDYPGPAPRLLAALADMLAPSGDMMIGQAVLEGAPVAGIALVRHGRSATYQAGWTTPEGRDTCAHHLLLWEAARMLKQNKVFELDLGGINEHTPGLTTFKQGLGGVPVRLAGHYI